MTGVYKITNTHNGKRYFGQSIDIYKRWKQHTHNLKTTSNETILRRAFRKYGLFSRVAEPGVYNGFVFEIIEECETTELLEREYFYIRKEKPEYNLMGLKPIELNNFKYDHIKHAGETFVQYHNFDTEKHYPGIEETFDENDSILDCTHYISTRKKIAPYLDGAVILLIVGKSYRNKKKYFIWTKTVVDEMHFLEDEELSYNIIGDQKIITPCLLNNIEGFDRFKKEMGNFAFGIVSVKNKSFSSQLYKIVDLHQLIENIPIKSYLCMVEKELA